MTSPAAGSAPFVLIDQSASSPSLAGIIKPPPGPPPPPVLPMSQDTGLKPKSRWFYRSEQETSSLSTSSSNSVSNHSALLVNVITPSPPATAPSPITAPSTTVAATTMMTTAGQLSSASASKFVATFSAINNLNLNNLNSDRVVSLPSFEYIKENIYLLMDKKKSKKGKESRLICECTKEDAIQTGRGCGDECLNRLLYYECGPNCPCGTLCTNVRFQKFEYGDVEPFPAGKKGFGLRAVKNIEKHTFVIEYVGEVLNATQFRHRCKQYAKDSKHSHHYFMALKNDEIIDATRRGNISRFMNHSCEPNCETQKWTVNGHLRIGFFTIKDVKAHEELTFDYRFQRYGKEAQKCYCGAPSCRGYIDAGDPAKKQTMQAVIDKEEKISKKEPKALFEDNLLDREFDDILSVGCLRNRDHVVTFGRIMLRADDYDSRRKLIDLLLNSESTILRLFVDLHGCTLLWSWMVDDEACAGHWQDFQLKVLSMLKLLPVPHKNMLQDSRVLSVVERWGQAQMDNLLRRSENVEEIVRDVLSKIVQKVCNSEISPFNFYSEDSSSSGSSDILNEVTLDSSEDVLKKAKEIKSKVDSLLKQWSALKENFKIPKKPENHKKSGEKSSKSKTKHTPSIVLKSKSGKSYSKHDYSSRYSKYRKRSRSRSRTRSRERTSRSRSRETTTSSKRRRDSSSSSDKRYGSSGNTNRTRLTSGSSHSSSLSSRYVNSSSFNGTATSTSTSNSGGSKDKRPTTLKRVYSSVLDSSFAKKLKEERRRQFEQKMAREEEMRNYNQQMKDFELDMAKAVTTGGAGAADQSVVTSSGAPISGIAPMYDVVAGQELDTLNQEKALQMAAHQSASAYAAAYWQRASQAYMTSCMPKAVPPPSLSSTPKAPVAPTPGASLQLSLPAELYFDPTTEKYWWRDRSTGVFVYPANNEQVTMYLSGDTSCIPHFYHDEATGLIHEMRMPLTTAAVPTNYASQDDRNEVDMVCGEDESTSLLPRDQRISIIKQQIISLRNQLEQKQAELKWLLEQESEESSTSKSDDAPVAQKPKPQHLPKNWRVAYDTDGKPYYYHISTKQTQWDPPECGENETEESPLVHSSSHSSKFSASSSSAYHKKSTTSSNGGENSIVSGSGAENPVVLSGSAVAENSAVSSGGSAAAVLSSTAVDPTVSSATADDASTAADRQHRHKRRERAEQQRKLKVAMKIMNAARKAQKLHIITVPAVTESSIELPAVPPIQPSDKTVTAATSSTGYTAVNNVTVAAAVAAAGIDSNPQASAVQQISVVAVKPEPVPEPVYPVSVINVKAERPTPTPIADSSFITTPCGTTQAAADTSSEVARKLKENFKSSISNHIIRCLNPYRKQDCKTGRITNNDDFKHVARKLTHAIMEKELKHCQRVEDLRATDSVLHKAKDYIKRYMGKFGQVYKRGASSP